MEQLRKLGALGRQHYEKLILTVALLVLAGACYFLYQARVVEEEKIKAIPGDFKTRKVKPVHAADITGIQAALQHAERPVPVNLSGPHYLFNPVEWRLDRATQTPVKIRSEKDVGVQAMQLVGTKPLQLQIVFGSPTTSGAEDQLVVLGYLTHSTNETIHPRSTLRKVSTVVNVGETNRQAVFYLREVKGDVRQPTELVGELKEFGGEKFTFAPGRPYTRVLTYEAELRHKPNPEKKYLGIRTNSVVDIEGQNYKVVDITPERVVLSDDSNGKQYSITK